MSLIFFNFKSHIANNYGFIDLLYLEVEKIFKSKKYDFEAAKEKSFISPAVIKAVNNNGSLLVQYEDTEETYVSGIITRKNVSSASKAGKQSRIAQR